VRPVPRCTRLRVSGVSQLPAWRRVRIPPPQPEELYGGTKRELWTWEHNRAILFGGIYIRRPSPQRWGSGIWEINIWSRVQRNSDLRITALSKASNNCKTETRPLVKEGIPHQQTRNRLTEKSSGLGLKIDDWHQETLILTRLWIWLWFWLELDSVKSE
jgi:hypothetical protein